MGKKFQSPARPGSRFLPGPGGPGGKFFQNYSLNLHSKLHEEIRKQLNRYNEKSPNGTPVCHKGELAYKRLITATLYDSHTTHMEMVALEVWVLENFLA